MNATKPTSETDISELIAKLETEAAQGKVNLYHQPYSAMRAAKEGKEKPGLFEEQLERDIRYKMFKTFCAQRGRRYIRCTLDNFDTLGHDAAVQVKKELREFSCDMPNYLRQGAASLLFLGQPGNGKDHVLMALMRSAIVDHGMSVRWFDGLELYAKIKKNNFADIDAIIAECVGAQILAISDPVPPRGELGNWDLSTLRRIVERRYSEKAAIWITSNVTDPQEAKELFGSAVLSRLIDNAKTYHFSWPTYRKEQA